MDVDRNLFDQRQHSGLQGLEDDRLGLQGSCSMSQRHSCNQRFRLDGNLRANRNRPLDWKSLSGCNVGWEVGRERDEKTECMSTQGKVMKFALTMNSQTIQCIF